MRIVDDVLSLTIEKAEFWNDKIIEVYEFMKQIGIVFKQTLKGIKVDVSVLVYNHTH